MAKPLFLVEGRQEPMAANQKLVTIGASQIDVG
jgi:hypothetical protein